MLRKATDVMAGGAGGGEEQVASLSAQVASLHAEVAALREGGGEKQEEVDALKAQLEKVKTEADASEGECTACGGVQNGPLGAGGGGGEKVVELKARVGELQVPRVEGSGFTGVPCS